MCIRDRLNLIDRDVFGDHVTKFMTEAMISHNLLLKTQMYYGYLNNDMQLRQRQPEQLDDDESVEEVRRTSPSDGAWDDYLAFDIQRYLDRRTRNTRTSEQP